MRIRDYAFIAFAAVLLLARASTLRSAWWTNVASIRLSKTIVTPGGTFARTCSQWYPRRTGRDVEQAREAYRHAVAWRGVARTYLLEGNDREAELALNRSESHDVLTALDLGLLANRRGDDATRRTRWAPVPNFDKALVMMGEAQTAALDFRGAAHCFQEATELNPANGNAWLSEGWTLTLLGSPRDGVTALDHAIEHLPNGTPLAIAYAYRGEALAQLREFPAAGASCAKAVALAPDSLTAQFHCGNAAVAAGDFVHAEEWLRRAIALDRSQPDAYVQLSGAYLAAGNVQSADQVCRDLVNIAPTDARAASCEGHVAFARGDYAAAVAHFSRARERQPNDVSTLYWLSRSLIAANRPADAIDLLKRAAQLDPSNVAVRQLQSSMPHA